MQFPENDRALYEMVFDLRRRSINTEPLTEGDVDASILTALAQTIEEYKRRGLPDMYNPSVTRWEIRWGEPAGDSVTFHKELYESMDDAMARALQLKEAFKDVDGYP